MIFEYSEGTFYFSGINPSYDYQHEIGLVNVGAYLLQVGEGEAYKSYEGQLPTFMRPSSNNPFKVSVFTRYEWDYRGIWPVQPEIGEFVVEDGSWEVEQTRHSMGGQEYYKTTWTGSPLASFVQQKYIWRYDASEI